MFEGGWRGGGGGLKEITRKGEHVQEDKEPTVIQTPATTGKGIVNNFFIDKL